MKAMSFHRAPIWASCLLLGACDLLHPASPESAESEPAPTTTTDVTVTRMEPLPEPEPEPEPSEPPPPPPEAARDGARRESRARGYGDARDRDLGGRHGSSRRRRGRSQYARQSRGAHVSDQRGEDVTVRQAGRRSRRDALPARVQTNAPVSKIARACATWGTLANDRAQ